MVLKYYSWSEYVDETKKLMDEGISLVSPGYFQAHYGLSRQLINNWAVRDNLIRQYNCYLSDPNKAADIVLIPVEDVLEVLRGKKGAVGTL